MTDRTIDVAAWLPPGEYDRADPIRRAAWLRGVAESLRLMKVRQIEQGIGADGRPLRRVLPTSRPDGTRDRPLIPHDDRSRTIRLLKVTSNVRKGSVTFHWNAWTRIVRYHAEGNDDPLPKRDVQGTPGRYLRPMKAKALADWRRMFPFLPATLQLEAALVARGPGRAAGAAAVAAPPRPLVDRSVVARKRFGPSKAKVEFHPKADRDEFLAKVSALFGGRPVTIEELVTLTGAPDDATVTIMPVNPNFKTVWMKIKHPNYEAMRVLAPGEDPTKVVVENQALYIKKEAHGQGIGTKFLGRQVEQARKMGIETIETVAERGKESVGYKVWPKLGYDGPIPDRVRPILPDGLKGARNVSDLMETPEGRAWWETNGESVNMTFDTRRGSDSSNMLDAYLIKRGLP